MKNRDSVGYKFLISIQPYIVDVFKSYGWVYDHKKVYFTGMWAIINKKGNSNNEHIHPNSNLSAAYYVKAPKDCGQFTIENPHSISRHSYPALENKSEFNVKVVKLEIEEGDLLLFPAYLPHGVQENKSDEDRIVISFNININNFK